MKKANILVVEDEAIVAMDIKARLASLGYEVVGQAATGDQAIRLAAAHEPDLIMMDIKIKGPIDGIETAEKIRSFLDVPVIYLTAFADEPTLQRARVTGPSGYILKPFQERELAIAIDMALYKHEMEKKLRESEERYFLAIQGANDGIWDWDLIKNTIYYSSRWKEITGYAEEEINSSLDDWLAIVHPDDRDRLQQCITHHLNGLSEHMECEIRMLHKDGSIRWVLSRGLAVRKQSDRPYRIAGSISDITSLKRAQEQLVYDAYHDALTGIPNRALFFDRLQNSLERWKRIKQDAPAVLFMDLDQFKVINDNLGHHSGDIVLAKVADRLQSLIRASDTVARLGGDEFVVLLESASSLAYACNVAERIAAAIKTPIQIGGRELIVSASIGVVMVTEEHQTVSEILHDADIAMYRAKSLGKDRYEVFHTHLSHQAEERLSIEHCLIGALERNEFDIHFQPIYSFPDRSLVGLEALLRLQPAGKQPIWPVEFIPVAEEIGLINQIGEWVLLESCKKMREWYQRYPDKLHFNLHINISVKQLESPNFVNRVKEILGSTGLPPSRLTLEINENVFTRNINLIAIVLEQITQLGVQLLIDNFGNGYASLGYIQRFTINQIKFDRNFVFSPAMVGKNTEVVRAILTMANQLGLSTVAEGIETEDQARYLIDLDCHYGQGYLFSRPMNAEQIETYFTSMGLREG